MLLQFSSFDRNVLDRNRSFRLNLNFYQNNFILCMQVRDILFDIINDFFYSSVTFYAELPLF